MIIKTPDPFSVSLQRQIDATDREIDSLVYDLYDLNKQEIALVEGTARN